jgi:HTH-type transcriptional regulator/antitoxin HigA
MARTVQNEYKPDLVSLPGDTLLEMLESIGMTQRELAERTGQPLMTIHEIITGKAAITPEMALQLEQVLGVPARFWNNRERHYREYLAHLEEEVRLTQQTDGKSALPAIVRKSA